MNIYFEAGKALWKKLEYRSAIEQFTKASEIYLAEVALEDYGQSVVYIANCHYILQEYDLAIIFFKKRLENITIQNKEVINVNDIIVNKINIGVCYEKEGNFDKSLWFYQQSLELFLQHEETRASNVSQKAFIYNNIGRVYEQKGNYKQATQQYDKAIEIWQNIPQNKLQLAQAFENKGNCYYYEGDYDIAIAYHQEALKIRSEKLDLHHVLIGRSNNNIALCYFAKKQYRNALDLYEKTEAIYLQKVGIYQANIARNQNNQGLCYELLGDYKTANRFFEKAIHIANERQAKYSEIDKYYHNLAGCFNRQKLYSEALIYYKKALNISLQQLGSKHPSVAHRYNEIAQIYLKYEPLHIPAALAHYEKALFALVPENTNNLLSISEIIEQKKYSSSLRLFKTLEGKGKAFYLLYSTKTNKIHHLKKALANYSLADKLIGQMRKSYKNEASKLLLAENASSIYEQALEVAVALYNNTQQKDFLAIAFAFSEKNKAVLLLSGMKEAEAQRQVHIEQEQLDYLYDLQAELSYLNRQIWQEQHKTNADEQKIKTYRSEHFKFTQKYNALISSFEKDFPAYYQLKYADNSVSIVDLQANLTANKVIVEYFVGKTLIYIFIIKNDDFHLCSVQKTQSLILEIDKFTSSIKTLHVRNYIHSAYFLYENLIKKIEPHLDGVQDILLIPDGQLLKIPFEALLSEKFTGKLRRIAYNKLHYLINKYRISYHYSANLCLYHHKKAEQLKFENLHAKQPSFVGFAPIDFDNIYASLPKSAEEVVAVAHLFEQKNMPNKVYVGKEAQLQHFKNEVKHFNYILVASHGVIDWQQPAASGIAFAKSSDAKMDNMLYRADTYNLHLQADLVVLSACESGIGELAKGEGMMGINRGFMYSGAKNIIFTLFKIPDETELITALFKNILNKKDYARSLYEAKKQLIERNTFVNKWAGFVLISC
ncbi:MAG: CHAT domain-containing protein [Chitinophagales bacterium]